MEKGRRREEKKDPKSASAGPRVHLVSMESDEGEKVLNPCSSGGEKEKKEKKEKENIYANEMVIIGQSQCGVGSNSILVNGNKKEAKYVVFPCKVEKRREREGSQLYGLRLLLRFV